MWPLRLLVEKRTSELILDPMSFPECVSKEVRIWQWKKMKTVKYIVHHKKDGTYDVMKLE
ncbi:MAG: hypothetical protein DDT26_02372 [Dehalococcoidia bacterium]|nr:hypothetical protein [Chloroflexota bacterium]